MWDKESDTVKLNSYFTDMNSSLIDILLHSFVMCHYHIWIEGEYLEQYILMDSHSNNLEIPLFDKSVLIHNMILLCTYSRNKIISGVQNSNS